MLDTAAIRQDFPILSRQVHGKPLVYLDNAATSQKPRAVIEAMSDYYLRYNANVHRGIHALSEEATAAYEEVRSKVVAFIGAGGPEQVIFTRNATEAINLAAHSWGRHHIGAGDEIVLTEMEHHSNLVPWQLLAQEKQAVLRFIAITEDGRLDLTGLDNLITRRTKLVSIVHASNVLGTINPVRQIARLAHGVGARILVDGAQSAPHMPLSVAELECDFFALSGHKMLGPTGIGVLFASGDMLDEMQPFLGGGDMIREVWLERSTWNDPPWKFEAGTPNVAGAIGLGAAIDYLNALGMDQVRLHEKKLTAHALQRLGAIADLTLYGPRDVEERGGVVAFNYAGLHPHDLAQVLDSEGIAIRAGHHCAQPLMRRLGVPSTARASFYVYNTMEEVDFLAEALPRVRAFFGGVVGAA